MTVKYTSYNYLPFVWNGQWRRQKFLNRGAEGDMVWRGGSPPQRRGMHKVCALCPKILWFLDVEIAHFGALAHFGAFLNANFNVCHCNQITVKIYHQRMGLKRGHLVRKVLVFACHWWRKICRNYSLSVFFSWTKVVIVWHNDFSPYVLYKRSAGSGVLGAWSKLGASVF